jgi:hypothetical protein
VILVQNEEALLSAHPMVFHVAARRNWLGIKKRGLLSTAALLDLFGVTGPLRNAILKGHRRQSHTLKDPQHGVAEIRDQEPLNPKKLAACLIDMSVEQWFELLNQMVFFFPTKQQAEKFLGLPKYVTDDQILISTPTRALISRHRDKIRLSAINSGATVHVPAERGSGTFQDIDAFDRSRNIAEVTVIDGVPEVASIAERIEVFRNGQPLETL